MELALPQGYMVQAEDLLGLDESRTSKDRSYQGAGNNDMFDGGAAKTENHQTSFVPYYCDETDEASLIKEATELTSHLGHFGKMRPIQRPLKPVNYLTRLVERLCSKQIVPSSLSGSSTRNDQSLADEPKVADIKVIVITIACSNKMGDSKIWENLRDAVVRELGKIRDSKAQKKRGYESDFYVALNIHNEGSRVPMSQYDRVKEGNWHEYRSAVDEQTMVAQDTFL